MMNYWQAKIDSAPKTRVALVQVDPSYVVSLGQLRELTDSVANDVDIVCWPESSGGNYELSLDELSDERRVFECSREPERGLRPWPALAPKGFRPFRNFANVGLVNQFFRHGATPCQMRRHCGVEIVSRREYLRDRFLKAGPHIVGG